MNSILLDLSLELRGGQRQVLYLAHMLQTQADMNSFIVCPRESALAKAAAEQNLPLITLPGRSLVNPAVLFVLRRIISRNHIDLVHTHDARAATMGSWLKTLQPQLKLVHSRRVSYQIKPGVRSKKYMHADMVVGVSREISDGLIAHGIPKEKVCTIHSGIDPSLYSGRKERKDGRFVFGAVGALTEQKGFSVLIKAMSVIREAEDLSPWEVRIAGQGPLFNNLLQEARGMQVDDRLVLLGHQPSSEVMPLFDALIVPSVNGEGSSAVIKEGWAVGLPVVCTALPSNEELVRDKENGLVVAKENPLALGAAMLQIMKNAPLRQRLVASGRQSLAQFTDKHMGRCYCHLYRKLMGVNEVETAGSPQMAFAGPEAEELRPELNVPGCVHDIEPGSEAVSEELSAPFVPGEGVSCSATGETPSEENIKPV